MDNGKRDDLEYAILETVVRFTPPFGQWLKRDDVFGAILGASEVEMHETWKLLVEKIRRWNGTGRTIGPVRRRLPDERESRTHKFTVGGVEGYLIVGLFEDGTPGEVFIKISKEGSTLSGVMDSFAIGLSFNLQWGVPLNLLCKKYQAMNFPPSGETCNPLIPHASSIVDYIQQYLMMHWGPPKNGTAK